MLYELQELFEENDNKILFDKDGKPFYKIDKNDFKVLAKNEDENRCLDALQS